MTIHIHSKSTQCCLFIFALILVPSVCGCTESGPKPADDADVDAAGLDSAFPEAAVDLGYPDWVFVGSCDDLPLGVPILNLATAPHDGLTHLWLAGFPGSVYSETELHNTHRCVLRRAHALGMRYGTCFLAANAISVTGTFNQALELSRDPRLEQMAVASSSGISGL